ncbi:hypothetical protein MTR67_048599 [Solanum verrucosum]|uniref:Uncharacterized protein n=1 Tax=Solanum verrucosum TaxID=315347 RepID=A0AAF0V139_SOLVR|nr:hypothetical protein MTR67_048599 [Solanum verrucosum]
MLILITYICIII